MYILILLLYDSSGERRSLFLGTIVSSHTRAHVGHQLLIRDCSQHLQVHEAEVMWCEKLQTPTLCYGGEREKEAGKAW